MKVARLSALAALLVLLFGCSSPGIDTTGNPIASVEILDFNWENGITTTYLVEPGVIKVSSNEPKPYEESPSLSAGDQRLLSEKLGGIVKIYEGDFTDEQVADGVNVEFRFTLRDGTKVSTKLSNIRIETYAKLTEAVSSLVSRDIQYHQYDLSKHR